MSDNQPHIKCKLIKRWPLDICSSQETAGKRYANVEQKKMKSDMPADYNYKRTDIAILISEKVGFQISNFIDDYDG